MTDKLEEAREAWANSVTDFEQQAWAYLYADYLLRIAEAAESLTDLLYNGVGWHDPPGAQEPGGKQGSCLDPEDSIALEKASDELLAALSGKEEG